MPGLYVKLDTAFVDDERIEAAGWDGAGVYAHLLCLAKRLEKDGHVGAVQVRRHGFPARVLKRLCDLGLIVSDPDGGYTIASWLDHNISAAEVKERRKADAERKRQARALCPDGLQADSERSPAAAHFGVPAKQSRGRDDARTPVVPPLFTPSAETPDFETGLAAIHALKGAQSGGAA